MHEIERRLRDRAAERRAVGWELSDAMLPGDMEATADHIARLEAALRAIYAAADGARDEQDWGDRVSAAMTDERRALVTQP